MNSRFLGVPSRSAWSKDPSWTQARLPKLHSFEFFCFSINKIKIVKNIFCFYSKLTQTYKNTNMKIIYSSKQTENSPNLATIKVKLYGPAVEGPVRSSQPTHFVVDAKEAGPGRWVWLNIQLTSRLHK